MANPWGVLVVPVAGDPGDLVHGCTPLPIPGGDKVRTTYTMSVPRVSVDLGDWVRTAFPLWWDGALVPEGWDRARRVWGKARFDSPNQWAPYAEWQAVAGLARELVGSGLASRVVLLDLVDGRVVERAQ